MKAILIATCFLLICEQAHAHWTQKGVDCDYTMLDGVWTVFYPAGDMSDPDLEESARLAVEHIGENKHKKQEFEVALVGSDTWDLTDHKGTEVTCSNSAGLLIEIPVLSEAGEAKLCVQRVGQLVGLMMRDNETEPNLRQIGLYIIDTKKQCDDDDYEGPRTPGHAHADD